MTPDTLTLELTTHEAQIIVNALQEMPYRFAAPLLDKIMRENVKREAAAGAPPEKDATPD